MSEDYGIVHYKKFSQGNSISALNAIRDCIVAAADGYWEIDGSISLSNLNTQLALKAKNNPSLSSFPFPHGNPNDQRIAIKATGTDKLELAYAPDGWGTISNFDSLTSTTKTWTRFKSITGSTAGISNVPTTAYVVQYRDNNITTPYPASTLAVILGNVDIGTMQWCAYAGRGITVQNPSDFNLGLFGDCLLIGTAVFTGAGVMSGTSALPDSSIVRTGNNCWHYANGTGFEANHIGDIGDIKRVLPFQISCSNGRAIPTVDATIKFGVVGLTKYLRKARFLYTQGNLKSKTTNSKQQWKPVSTNTTGNTPVNNQYILWGPENLVT